ncbi:MAG: hypothetical protein ACR2MZ_02785 [Candidatus Dormibacter sp.]|uniref:hypothetical protein n=1 Tax=Candidatus Dormibacter sp. TaxID=2973982 RepID=UPI000DB1DF9B|nr:MAG: hypothetical protein DLM66_10610 [Candidatus Dormibacteraeota bacterium]
MIALVLGEATGWLVAALVAANISLPYLLRRRRLAPHGWSLPYLERMRPHYWIGVTIAGLSLVHAGVAMSGPMSRSPGYGAGLWVATGAMLVAGGQVMIGMRLRSLRGSERLRLRKTHYRVMAMLVVLGLLHVALNGALPQSISRIGGLA